MARLLAARRGDPPRIEGVSDPSDPDRELFESGALLSGPHAILAGPTFEEWLDVTLTRCRLCAGQRVLSVVRFGRTAM
jgi:hypothetical protein